ncbi:hypothetical protein AKJ62_04805 [candidate division MSBL1 archaeon SCGC-AAA259D14]|uniref:Uncharacterized protein n=1 Tax=candidate division MSBL1 archaeon SCGC-AAA259D14 TaxID=1698261 RepID=A0A133U366_9EURY|nr:hypothetical protein AKJ62_04805 [candidate division MSBL1 archaeon SCGC-AAA259D14]
MSFSVMLSKLSKLTLLLLGELFKGSQKLSQEKQGETISVNPLTVGLPRFAFSLISLRFSPFTLWQRIPQFFGVLPVTR